MRRRSFNFEIQDLLIQFLAAFDNVVIGRFNADREEEQKIQVRYVYAPKQRVIYDLINKAQNITLPVVSVNIGSIARDDSRVFSKNTGFLTPALIEQSRVLNDTPFFRTPVPVNIGISMSILTKNQMDLDQIIGNFIPYTNPYIILSWKVPKEFSPKYDQEIRSEVLWDGNVAIKYPTEMNGTQKYEVSADVNFTIKGWIFPSFDGPAKNIYKIDVSTFAVKTDFSLGLTSYSTLSALGVEVSEDNSIVYSNTITIDGKPQITNVESKNF